MFINNFDPVAFQIISFEIRWYSLAYIFGIVIGWLLCKKIFIQKSDIIEKFDDFLTYLIIGIIIGGRLGYVIFYNFDYYISNIFDIFKVWQGGMSFHGGLLGIIVASILFAKKNNQNPFLYGSDSFSCSHWDFFWKNSKFHQFRTLWSAHRCFMVCNIHSN